MQRFLFLLLACELWAGISPFSHTRVASYKGNGEPSEEIIDLTVCLERNPVTDDASDRDSREKYETIFNFWADAIFEMSNGGNYLGKIRIFPDDRFVSGCDVIWRKCGVWPNANVGAFNHGGALNYSDYFSGVNELCEDHDGEDRRKNVENAAGTLAHESMHYIYGLYDEYGDAEINPQRNEIALSVDVDADQVILTKSPGLSLEKFKAMIEPYKQKGTLVKFKTYSDNPEESAIPGGLRGEVSTALNASGRPYRIEKSEYAAIDKIYTASEDEGIFAFTLKNVDITNKGIAPWGLTLPTNASSTPNTISWSSGAFDANKKCNVEPQWQWWNFSSPFNVRRYSPQGMNYRKDDKVMSGWDVLVSNPDLDQGFGVDSRWPRRWFKSLIGRAPTKEDIYQTTTFLNYDEETSWWPETDATWWENDDCSKLHSVSLPYMKSELAGKTEEEYSKQTRKYLDVEWIEKTKMEVVVVIDRSGSMNSYNKMAQAKMAAKFVAGGFLSDDDNYDASNVSVGIYSFNTEERSVLKPAYNPSLKGIYSLIDQIKAGGRTALFDALDEAIKSFSNDASSLKLLYVISDGKDNESEKTKDDIIKLYQSRDIAIHTFAYGKDADRDLLSSMASETGGTYYEQEESLFLKVNNAVSTVLSNAYGNEQIAADSLGPAAKSQDIYVPGDGTHLRILGSYKGDVVSTPLSITSKEGSKIQALVQNFPMDDVNYFILEMDSITLSHLTSPYIRIVNKLESGSLDYRAIVTESHQEHSMDVQVEPFGNFSWPFQGKFYASVQGKNGLLARLSTSGILIFPDGSTHDFVLYDDGSNGDAFAGDGIYTTRMPPLNGNGTYQWQIALSNANGIAQSTRIGSSLPDSISFTPVIDREPFRFIRNGQFVVSGCCSDESEETYPVLMPNSRLSAYLQDGGDVDRFRIAGTQSGKSYSLVLSSSDLASFKKIDIFSPKDLKVPVYSATINSTGGRTRMSVPMSAEYALPGFVVAVSGNGINGAVYDLLLLESDYASFSVGRFEVSTDWKSEQGSIALDANRKSEGMHGLVSPGGWKIIESRSVSTKDFELVGNKMAVDVYVPSNTSNPYWIGNMELWLDVPSSNRRIHIGKQVQLVSYFGGFFTYSFDVPQEMLDLFAEPHSDVHFQIVLNSADSIWLDHLRFSGTLQENPVNKWAPSCPGESGCDATNPIQLKLNESIRFVAAGDLWVELVGLPKDWMPKSIYLGIASEDGSPLTGSLSMDDSPYPLGDWYWQKSFDYIPGKRYLMKIHNLGGRPYRMTAWATDQAINIASR